jgi:PAS domain S-box-containing protein
MSHIKESDAGGPGVGSAIAWTTAQALRRQAEALVLEQTAGGVPARQALEPDDPQRVLHELQVHQIELEMQNDELRRSHVELEAVRARYFDLYDLAPVGYFTVSEPGLIVEANFTAATLLGVPRRQLVGQLVSRFILRAGQDHYYQFRKKLFATGERQSCELQMSGPEGTPLWVHLSATVVQDGESGRDGGDDGAGDGPRLLRMVLVDVTERHRLEQLLQDKNIELERARQQADTANQAKSDFLSSMSHELRSPLNAILGFAQLMDSGSPPPLPVQKARIEHILQAGWHLLALINEILDLALIESGKLALVLEPLSLPEVLLDCQMMVEPQAQQRGLSLHFPVLEAPCQVLADRTRLKQVLVNLLSNAIKYNREGGQVTVCCHTVPMQGAPVQRLRISVHDTGQGLPPEKIAQLFQSFNRLGQESSAVEGTGIGLVVSKRLVELMQGEIGVCSTVGTGSEFWIELALAVPAVPAPVAAAPVPDALHPAQGTPSRTLLYVEDNPANMALMEALIERRPGLHLLGAPDGLQGVAMARAHLPAVILMDINLPGLSGLQAMALLRADPATARIPVLALSANAMPGDIASGLAAGFLRYLTKPIQLPQFMAALDLALQEAGDLHPSGDTA